MNYSDAIISKIENVKKISEQQSRLHIAAAEKTKEVKEDKKVENNAKNEENKQPVNEVKETKPQPQTAPASSSKIPKVEENTDGNYNVQKEEDAKQDTIQEKNTDQEQYPDSSAVFKVDAYKIKGELSFLDKAKILEIASKIPPSDYYKLKDYLTNDDPVEGIINTFSLLRLRLGSKDYETIKKIASKYLDVDCVEKYIKNSDN